MVAPFGCERFFAEPMLAHRPCGLRHISGGRRGLRPESDDAEKHRGKSGDGKKRLDCSTAFRLIKNPPVIFSFQKILALFCKYLL
jgi:hypothetical protein